jgi:hypothetical protein
MPDDTNDAPDPVASEIERLRRQVKSVMQERRAEREADEKRQAEARRQAERGALEKALLDSGADPRRTRAAVALLHAEEQRVRLAADGEPVWVDEYGDEIDLQAGVSRWLASEDGEPIRLPPAPKPRSTPKHKDPRAAARDALWRAVTGTDPVRQETATSEAAAGLWRAVTGRDAPVKKAGR